MARMSIRKRVNAYAKHLAENPEATELQDDVEQDDDFRPASQPSLFDDYDEDDENWEDDYWDEAVERSLRIDHYTE